MAEFTVNLDEFADATAEVTFEGETFSIGDPDMRLMTRLAKYFYTIADDETATRAQIDVADRKIDETIVEIIPGLAGKKLSGKRKFAIYQLLLAMMDAKPEETQDPKEETTL